MSQRDTRDNPPQFFIGPDMSTDTPSDAESLMSDARDRVREEDEYNKESTRLVRRLLIAFVAIIVLGVGFYVVLPQYGVRLPPLVPLLCFGAIAVGAVLNTGESPYEDYDFEEDDEGCGEGGCAVGMCPGPRPLKMFQDPKKRKKRKK